LTLLGDPTSDLDERLQPASPRPFQPCLEQHEGMFGRDAVDLAQLLAEQARYSRWLSFWIRASLSCWRSVRWFFQSANRAPLSSRASCV
jgi:hypothetical protein